ncbi:hypothetical protein ACFY9F_23830 [Streptomyces sp. NPDC012421]|uniref:hypothetical protein n=1 Tax=Streptomyces sp. NPDC012421 TaxID=3364832 RepID=UPI0036E9AB16
MTVLIGARDPRTGEESAAAVRATGGEAYAVTLDVTDHVTVQQLTTPTSSVTSAP